MATARTFLAWFEYLDVKGRELTMEELQALLLCQIREYARLQLELQQEQAQATGHIEGMLGARDAFDAMIAQQAGVPYPASATVREALHAQRRRAALTDETPP